jgi:hypothetical protein
MTTANVDSAAVYLKITESPKLRQVYGWKTQEYTPAELENRFSQHRRLLNKEDCAAFVPGVIQGERRQKSGVSELSLLVLDLDRGEDIDVILGQLRSANLYAIIYSTHSHMSSETEIKLDDYRRFANSKHVTVEGLRRFLFEQRKFRPWIVETVEIVDRCRETPNGMMCVARHAPLAKYRVVLPLRTPFRRADHVALGMSQAEFEALWKAKYESVARSLKVEWDAACSDVARSFYFPSCKPSAVTFTETIAGQRLDLNAFHVEDATQDTRWACKLGREAKTADQSFVFEGQNLLAWIRQYGATFEIEKALQSRPSLDIFRSSAPDQPKTHILCPFEHTHTENGGSGTFVVNASENEGRGFGIHCCHAHCLTERGNGTKVDRLVFIQKMLEEGWLTLDDLQNPAFGGGQVSGEGRQALRRDLRVVDRDGQGIEVGIFHANIITASGQFDFGALNRLCRTQIDEDITAQQMAEFIEAGRVTIANLIECAQTNGSTEEADPYVARLCELARKKSAGTLLSHQIDAELAAIRAEFNVKQKAIEADFKRVEQRAQSSAHQAKFGLLSAEETKLIKPLRDYVERFAIVNTGGKAMVMTLDQPDLSKALMAPADFELLHKKEWIEVKREDGTHETIFPAHEFLRKPPKSTHVFNGGFVFKPSGTVAADQFNLYRGMLVAPDASGSCSLLRELVEDVWSQGDKQAAKWVWEYLLHIVAHPGDKVGTCIAIRGEPGDGKSIVFEQLMSKVLGDMLLRVTNHKLILGDFNEALVGKLLTVLEEAAFAGDKQAFDKMKELITGEKVVINAKFRAPITLDNHSRLIVISNHDHFLHIKPGDRRYTVLESSSSWQGTNKFEQLLDEWAKGGAARFVYEALNHSFRQLDGRQRLVINTNLKTAASSRQMALSRSSLEKCIVAIVLRGDFTSPSGEERFVHSEAGMKKFEDWKWDAPLDIRSQDLEQFVRWWVGGFDHSAARHETTLHTIIATLHRYAGATEEWRPKGTAEEGTNRRTQLPTMRRLPPRSQAIEHAWRNGLITEEEYRAATSLTLTSTMPDDEDFLVRFEDAYRKCSPYPVLGQFQRRRQLSLPLMLRDERTGHASTNRLAI